jgi:putative PIN family toxin of toxin-antitoxin system
MPERAVIDTNVLMRAFLKPGSATHAVIDAWFAGWYEIVWSRAILDEYRAVFDYPRIQKYGPDLEAFAFLLWSMETLAIESQPTGTVTVCRDARDNIFLDTALVGRASYIVTTDEDLWTLQEYKGVKIVHWKRFLNLIGYPWAAP